MLSPPTVLGADAHYLSFRIVSDAVVLLPRLCGGCGTGAGGLHAKPKFRPLAWLQERARKWP